MANRCRFNWRIDKDSGFLIITDLANNQNNAMSVTNGLKDVLDDLMVHNDNDRELNLDQFRYINPDKIIIKNTDQKFDAVFWNGERWVWISTDKDTMKEAMIDALTKIIGESLRQIVQMRMYD